MSAVEHHAPHGGNRQGQDIGGFLLLKQVALLEHLLEAVRQDLAQIAVQDSKAEQSRLENWPAPGSVRELVYRPAAGSDNVPVPTGGVLACAADEARIGGHIVNSGANAVILYLRDSAGAGKGAIFLAANGGNWDLRLGGTLWSGNVFAVAQTAASSLTVALV